MLSAMTRRVRIWRDAVRLKRVWPLVLIDALLIIAAHVSVYSVRTVSLSIIFLEPIEFLGITVGILLILLYSFGAYHRIWPQTSGHDVMVLVKAVMLATILLVALDLPYRPRPMPLSVIIIGNMLALMGFVTVRYRSRVISGLSWHWNVIWNSEFPEAKTRVLIIGTDETGQITALRLKHHDGSVAYDVIGFVDDDPAKQNMYVEGSPVLGTRVDIPALVEKHKIDLIILAIHSITGSDLRDSLVQCEQTKARIKIVPDVFALLQAKQGSPLLRDIQPEDLLGRPATSWHKRVDNSPICGKTIMVTGAAGSIGSELCRQLLQCHPTHLILLDNNESGLHDLMTELQSDDNLYPALVDITNPKALRGIFERFHPQVVFHSAAYKHVPMLQIYPAEAVRVNMGGTLHLAELARDYQAERFVLISTDKAVGPSSVMGASKRICEQIIHEQAQLCHNHTLFTSVRFGNVLGSRGSIVPLFSRQIDYGGPVTVTDKDMTRFFMTIPEAVNLVIHAACLTTGNTLYMLQMGEDVRIVELAERMIRLRGLRPYVDIPIEFTGVRPGEKLHESLYTDDEHIQPTLHPGIVQLVNHRNGYQGIEFLNHVRYLIEHGFDENREPLEQLLGIIAVWEHEHAYRETS